MHKLRNINGQKFVNTGNGWEEISEEEFFELLIGGYELIEEDE